MSINRKKTLNDFLHEIEVGLLRNEFQLKSLNRFKKTMFDPSMQLQVSIKIKEIEQYRQQYKIDIQVLKEMIDEEKQERKVVS